MKKLLYLCMVLAVLASVVLPYSLNVGNQQFGAGVARAGSTEYQVVFTTVGTDYWIVPTGVTSVKVLVVAGGGGGASRYFGGGGGAGGVLYDAAFSVTPGGNITVVVGDHGHGATPESVGANGGNSSFGNISTTGGGGGGVCYIALTHTDGQNGGSGGGGPGYGVHAGSGTAGPPRQGYDGGVGYAPANYGAGGGGGAGAVGSAGTTNGGNGGIGVDYSAIFGTGVGDSGWFSSGGGGSGYSGVEGTASVGGGGNGADQSTQAQSADANTGGGGGGGCYSSTPNGGNGGTGVVIVKYTVTINDHVTTAATSITYNSATLNGNITTVVAGNSTDLMWVWDTSSKTLPTDGTYGTWSNGNTTSGSYGVGAYSYTTAAGNLTHCTLYYYAFGSKSNGYWGWGNVTTLTTCGVVVNTKAATNIAPTSATLNGNITVIVCNDATETYWVWDTVPRSEPSAGAPGTYQYGNTSTGNFTTGNYSLSLSNLLVGQTYYFRFGSHSDDEWSWGGEANFTTARITATKDAWLPSSAPDTNYGSGTYLVIDGLDNSVLEFSISTLGNITEDEVDEAILHLYYYSYSTCNDPVGKTSSVYQMTKGNWTEAGVTWNKYDGVNSWASPGGDYDAGTKIDVVTPSVGAWMTWDITDIVKDELSGNSTTIDLLVESPGYGGYYCRLFYSDEYTTEALRPYLTIVLTSVATVIDTLAASNITNDSARLNGNITDLQTGGNVLSNVFAWDTATHSLGNVTDDLMYGNYIHCFGDSITAGYNASGEGYKYVSLVADNEFISPFGWTKDNRGLAGAETPTIASKYVYKANPIYNYSKSLGLFGVNDSNHWGNDSVYMSEFSKIMYAIATWNTIPLAEKIYAQDDPHWTYSGTWWDNNGRYDGDIGRQTVTVNDYAEVILEGTAIYIGLTAVYPSYASGASYQIKVDTVEKATGSTSFGKEPTASPSYVPIVIRVGDLSSGNHTVRITKTDATAYGLYLDWAGSNGGNTTNFYLGNCLYRPGYLGLGSGAAVTELNNVMEEVATNLTADGLKVTYVDANTYIDLDEDFDTDNTHPVNSGHAHIAQAFNDAIEDDVQNYNLTTIFDYAYYHHTNESQGVGAVYYDISSTLKGNLIYFRYIARNVVVSSIGDELSFYWPDISNTPSSHDFGVVAPNTTIWAKTNTTTPPSFPLANGNCTGNVTNDSRFAINVLFSMGNMTGGTQWTIGASPDTNVFRMRLYISGAGNSTVYTALSATPVELISNLSAGNHTHYEFAIDTPTNDPFSDGVQKSGNMTLAGEAA